MKTTWLLLLLSFIPLQAASPEPKIKPKSAPAIADQAQVRLLGRVTAVGTEGRWLRIEAGDVSLTVEATAATFPKRVRPGDRVLITGRLLASGRVQLHSFQTVPRAAAGRPLIGMLLSVDGSRNRLVMRTDSGRQLPVLFGADTTFVRLGRRSSATELRFGDRLWVDREAGVTKPASRIEVMGASARRFAGDGRISAINPARRQLKRDLAARRALFRWNEPPREESLEGSSFAALRIGRRVKVIGVEREGTVVARRVEVLPSSTQPRALVGRVQAINPGAGRLRVFGKSLVPMTTRVQVPTGLKVKAAGHVIPLRGLHVGDRVRIVGREGSTGVLTAQRIERLP